jgi:hypothetical protein
MSLTFWEVSERALSATAILGGPLTAVAAKFISHQSTPDALLLGILAAVTSLSGSEAIRRFRYTEKIHEAVTESIPNMINANLSRVEYIDNLAEVYIAAAQMIRTARDKVYDTTWGPEITYGTGKREKEARQEYQAVIAEACERGVTFYDLFGLGSEKRLGRIRDSLGRKNQSQELRDHEIRLARQPETAPLFDFLVVDSNDILLSADKKRYCRVQSTALAKLLIDYHEENWAKASKVELRDGELFYSDSGEPVLSGSDS